MHQFYIILVSIILEVAYNVLNRKWFDNFSFINFIYVIKVYFILFLLIYFIEVYIILFQITYLFYFVIILFAIKVCKKSYLWTLKQRDIIRKLVCYKGISFFWTYLNSIVFLCSKWTIESHIINLQPFLTTFVIFHAFTDYF